MVDRFDELKKHIETKVLPLTKKWEQRKREDLRKAIRRQESEESLDKFLDLYNFKIKELKKGFVPTKEEKRKKRKKLWMTNDFITKIYDGEGNLLQVKINIANVVDYLLENNNFKTIFGSKSEEIYVYEDGIYTKRGREIIQTETEKVLGDYCKNYYISEILGKIKRMTAVSSDEFDGIPEELICLENGVLNLKTKELFPHNPKYYFKSKIPLKYDTKAECKKIEEFFVQTLSIDDVQVLKEWFGFCLYRKYFIKKALILFGGTDTGKTVMINLLMKFIGEKNTSGISLQRISRGDKFALASLKDKYINAKDDLSSKDLEAGGFKEATGGGYITAEEKFGDSFQFMTFAKHTFTTNKIPSLKEIDVDDDAYYQRWIPIPCDNQVPKKEQDRFLIKKLTIPEELSGLLNWALEGLDKLLKKGKFSYNKTSEEIRKIMEKYGDPLASFCQEMLVIKEKGRISKEDMFQIYSLYAKHKKFTRLSKSQIGRRLPKYVTYLSAKSDAKERYWSGVGINMNYLNVDNFTNDLDTLDTFLKFLRKNWEYNNNHYDLIDMIKKNVSNMSKKGSKQAQKEQDDETNDEKVSKMSNEDQKPLDFTNPSKTEICSVCGLEIPQRDVRHTEQNELICPKCDTLSKKVTPRISAKQPQSRLPTTDNPQNKKNSSQTPQTKPQPQNNNKDHPKNKTKNQEEWQVDEKEEKIE